MSRFSKHKWWLLTILIVLPFVAIAADVPNVFKDGDVISSSQVNANFKNLSDRVTAVEFARPVVTYVRWGRTTCPAGATVVYAGYAAGGYYDNSGSGAGTLCLHQTPEWLLYDDANQDGATIYGTEFRTSVFGVSALVSLNLREATCVVCEVPRFAHLMIPGRTSCPAGWTLEYNGYLMSDHFMNQKNDWVCVDASPEAAGSSANNLGHLWYPTEVECGALPCQSGGYVQDRELACAVCTK